LLGEVSRYDLYYSLTVSERQLFVNHLKIFDSVKEKMWKKDKKKY
jgi:hypothetical protein